jgi:hypothetical protein
MWYSSRLAPTAHAINPTLSMGSTNAVSATGGPSTTRANPPAEGADHLPQRMGARAALSAAALLIAGREYRDEAHTVQPSCSIGSLCVGQPSGDPTSVLIARVGFEAKLSVDLVSNAVKRRILEVVMLIIRMCEQNPP